MRLGHVPTRSLAAFAVIAGLVCLAGGPAIAGGKVVWGWSGNFERSSTSAAVTFVEKAIGSLRCSTITCTANTASVSIGANQLSLLFVYQAQGQNPAVITDPGRTWTLVSRVNTVRGHAVYRSMTTTATSGAVTISTTKPSGSTLAMNNLMWQITAIGGVDTGGTNGAGAIGQVLTTDHTHGMSCNPGLLDLAAGAGPVIGMFSMNKAATTFTPGNGFGLFGVGTTDLYGKMRLVTKSSFGDPLLTWNNPLHCGGAAIEVRPASG